MQEISSPESPGMETLFQINKYLTDTTDDLHLFPKELGSPLTSPFKRRNSENEVFLIVRSFKDEAGNHQVTPSPHSLANFAAGLGN